MWGESAVCGVMWWELMEFLSFCFFLDVRFNTDKFSFMMYGNHLLLMVIEDFIKCYEKGLSTIAFGYGFILSSCLSLEIFRNRS